MLSVAEVSLGSSIKICGVVGLAKILARLNRKKIFLTPLNCNLKRGQELILWKKVADGMCFSYSETHDVFLQQYGFLDKELVTVADLLQSERPINQKWSWDRTLRSPYIKQAIRYKGFTFLKMIF